MTTHTPVLLQETIDALNIHPGGRYIDATYGLGGHAKAIRQAGGEVLALDADSASVKEQIGEAEKLGIKLVCSNYAGIAQVAKRQGFEDVDGVLFDLGLSMWQYRQSGRGFSFANPDEPLDMRFDMTGDVTARSIINSYSQEELYETFVRNSEELNSRSIARNIVRARRISPITTVGDLMKILSPSQAPQIFQALFVEVNDEFGSVRHGLEGAYQILKPGGRIAVISFHAGHDRIVKQFGRTHDIKVRKIEVKRPLASFERSATLRVLEK